MSVGGDDPPVISIVEAPASPPPNASSSPLAASGANASMTSGATSLNVSGRPGGGRRRSAAIRAATKEDADREPLLIKANREEHVVSVCGEGITLFLSNLQGWRKTNEDSHCALVQGATDVRHESRAPGRSASPPPPPNASLSEPPSIAQSTEPSPLPSGCASPEAQSPMRQLNERAIAETPIKAFLGVFDGHNGRATADYVAVHLCGLIAQAFRGMANATPEEEAEALRVSFQQCDDDLRASGVAGASGSTAACAVVLQDRVHLCSAGDCRIAAAAKDGHIVASITQDHTPTKNAAECDRVASLGASLEGGRINGKLAVTRAFGDFEFKDAAKPVREHLVLCVPTVVTVPRDDIHVIVAGCDGVWELNTIEDATASVAAAEDLDVAVSAIAHASCATNRPLNQMTMALSPGSDNITFAAIRFDDTGCTAAGTSA